MKVTQLGFHRLEPGELYQVTSAQEIKSRMTSLARGWLKLRAKLYLLLL